MYGSLNTDYLSEALVRAGQHWEQRRAARQRHQSAAHCTEPMIAISRQTGARGTTVARLIGKQLDWPVYDHELLERIAREMNVRVSLLESIDERVMPWLEERIETFLTGPTVNDASFFHHLAQTIMSLGEHGHAVVVGRGANFLLSSRTTLRVRLIAELEDRIAAMVSERGLSLEQAARHVRDTDRERARFIKEHFRVDLADPLQYDLTLNTSRLSVKQCAKLVLSALEELQQRLAKESPAELAAR